MNRAFWLPAHPAAGSASMDRYWRELERTRRLHPAAARTWQVDCVLGSPPGRSRQRGRVERAWQKYVAYPWRVRWATWRAGVDVAHVLDHSFAHLLASLPRRGTRKIVTVHDLAPLRDPTGLTPVQRRRFHRTVSHVREADLLLADSRHSAEEATALLGVPPEKIRVLPLGVDFDQFSTRLAVERDLDLPPGLAGRKVVLSVGAAISRKNLEVLPEILRRTQVDGLTLLRVGAALPPALLAAVQAILGKNGVVELGPVADAMLVRAYQRADALVLSSRIEGFGFPVLEAMAAGCPVVSTDVTSLPEVGGDAAWYFGPDDPAAAAGHLQRLLTDPALKAQTVAAGLERAAAFSWSRHFERLLEIYRTVAGGSQAAP